MKRNNNIVVGAVYFCMSASRMRTPRFMCTACVFRALFSAAACNNHSLYYTFNLVYLVAGKCLSYFF